MIKEILILPFSSLIPLLVSLIFIKRFRGRDWWIFAFIVFQVVKACFYYYTATRGIVNAWFTHVEAILPVTFLAIALTPIKLPYQINRSLLVGFIITIAVMLTGIDYFLDPVLTSVNVVPNVISALMILAIAFVQMKNQQLGHPSPLKDNPIFIISISIFWYYLGSFVFLSQFDNLRQYNSEALYFCQTFILSVYAILMVMISLSIFKLEKWSQHKH